ncbi:hypothetical protein [Curtobacterium sp. RRHDQ10]|uniref:hypothetical protein n=1 Tax=Curtobacterium phyllosphaerae TaxID=3413379 RepID=UPI003BF08DE2
MNEEKRVTWSVQFFELSARGARFVRFICRILRLDRFAYTVPPKDIVVVLDTETARALVGILLNPSMTDEEAFRKDLADLISLQL